MKYISDGPPRVTLSMNYTRNKNVPEILSIEKKIFLAVS